MNRSDITKGLRRSLEFYQEIGFQYLPLKITGKNGSEEVRKPRREEVGKSGSGRVKEQTILTPAEHLPDTITPSPNSRGSDKEAALKALREEIGDCQRCKLARNRRNIVFGEGASDAELMFIGEGPGRDEDIQARPFVGEAGKLLTSLIVNLGLKREDVYIANIVKCRPPNNREPEGDEIAVCMPFVERQIGIIGPKVIVTLGKVSTHALLRIKAPISRTRGNFLEYHDIPVMPTFHPAYLLRNRKDKWLTWEDMQKVLEKLRR